MTTRDADHATLVAPDGTVYDRVRVGDPDDSADLTDAGACRNCGGAVDNFHAPWCWWETCPHCGDDGQWCDGQWCSCSPEERPQWTVAQARALIPTLRDYVAEADAAEGGGAGDAPPEGPDDRDPNAVALGRKGGAKGGLARAAALTPKRRREIARKAAAARWGHPNETGGGAGDA